MAWDDAVVTNQGVTMLRRLLDGEEFHLDCAAGGAGTVSPVTLMAQTALRNQKQKFPITGSKDVEKGKKVSILITNQGLADGYNMQQVGIWARVGGGASVLMAILQDSAGFPVPAEKDMPEFVMRFHAVIDFSNEAEFKVKLDPTALVTEGMLREKLDERTDTGEPTAESTDKQTVSAARLWKMMGGALSTLRTNAKEIVTAINEVFSMAENAAQGAANAVQASEKGKPNGIATLDPQGKVPQSQLPEFSLPAQATDAEIDAGTQTGLRMFAPANIARAVRNTFLTGFAVGTNAAVVAGDRLMAALGKLQAQINNRVQTSAIQIAEPTAASTDGQITSSARLWHMMGGSLSSLESESKQIVPAINEALQSGGGGSGISFGTCPTAAGTAAKVITTTSEGEFEKAIGAMVVAAFTAANTHATPTANVDNTGAHQIHFNGQIILPNMIIAGHRVMLIFDGTNYQLLNPAFLVGTADFTATTLRPGQWGGVY